MGVVTALKLGGRRGAALLAGTGLALLLVPVALDRAQIFTDVSAGLLVLVWTATGLVIRNMKRRGLTNATSGLPNLLALRKASPEMDRPLVVARIINYPQIVSTLTPTEERSLVEQIVARLKVGSEVSTVYQGDEGIFAWTVSGDTAIGHHVEALAALFRSPAKVAGKPFDIAVSFGVEIGSGRSQTNRLNSALVAADEATAEGLRWKYHDPERLKDADWRLSLLSQLDEAIDQGQVWVAYQVQVDLSTNRLRGAEALARWTHPEKGPISPSEFITAAEQSDRIEKLTFFVLDKAVEAAAQINRDHGPFDMAVNLSARMLSDKTLPSQVRKVLTRHGLEPARLTLELTETAALASGTDTGTLFALRDLGVRISIDDYGTGLSTLEYLKKVPASEIKIDQSFVKSMRDHRGDLVMVQSTIALAHSLGRTVVAEGVETRELLDMLIAMKCEVAQGFIVGRPSSLNDLSKRLAGERKRRAA
jgi:EAL domain-containing protein (putative c-di-GMP-specific phosphodiesterase class I)